MDVDSLITFLAIHRTRSFSEAARSLHRTQPAISHRILQLERELGTPLFERLAGGIALSQAGAVLLPLAERALAAMEDAEAAMRALNSNVAGPVTLAIVGTLAGARLTPVLAGFAAKYPGVDLRLRTARSKEVSDLVRRGEATLGLRYGDEVSADLLSEKLGEERLRVVCGPRHPLAGQRIRTLASLRNERWIAFPEIPGQPEAAAAHVTALFQARGVGEVSWTAVDSLTAQKRLVEAGFGLALMPREQAAEELASRSLRTIKIADLKAGLPVHLISRKGGFLSVAARTLGKRLRAGYPAPTGRG